MPKWTKDSLEMDHLLRVSDQLEQVLRKDGMRIVASMRNGPRVAGRVMRWPWTGRARGAAESRAGVLDLLTKNGELQLDLLDIDSVMADERYKTLEDGFV